MNLSIKLSGDYTTGRKQDRHIEVDIDRDAPFILTPIEFSAIKEALDFTLNQLNEFVSE